MVFPGVGGEGLLGIFLNNYHNSLIFLGVLSVTLMTFWRHLKRKADMKELLG
jgi:hypothetical protein